MLKESVLVKDYKMVEGIKKDMLAKVDPNMNVELFKILEEYGNIFLQKLPYEPLACYVVNHEIELVLRSTLPHKNPYKFSNAEMEELRTQMVHCLSRVGSTLAQADMERLLFLF